MSNSFRNCAFDSDRAFCLSMALASLAHRQTMRVTQGKVRPAVAARLVGEMGRSVKDVADAWAPGAVSLADVDRAVTAVAQPRRPAPLTERESREYHGLGLIGSPGVGRN